jgi:hypothetical protein
VLAIDFDVGDVVLKDGWDVELCEDARGRRRCRVSYDDPLWILSRRMWRLTSGKVPCGG